VRDRVLADVPPSIGPVVLGTLGVGQVMVRCPQQYELMRRAGVFGSPARQWLIDPVQLRLPPNLSPSARGNVGPNGPARAQPDRPCL
jgi:hypothetical protein